MAELLLRPLRSEDVGRCAELHVEAFPGFYLSRLGPRFLREFYKGFVSDPDGIAVVAATQSGEVVGAVVGTREPHGFFSRLLKRRLFAFAFASVLVVLRRPSAAPRLLKAVGYRGNVPLQVSGALLSSICVDPRSQAQGVGSQLIDRFESAVQQHINADDEQDMAAYLLTDRDENEAANAFYAGRGWLLAGSYVTQEGRGMNCYVLPRRGGDA